MKGHGCFGLLVCPHHFPRLVRGENIQALWKLPNKTFQSTEKNRHLSQVCQCGTAEDSGSKVALKAGNATNDVAMGVRKLNCFDFLAN